MRKIGASLIGLSIIILIVWFVSIYYKDEQSDNRVKEYIDNTSIISENISIDEKQKDKKIIKNVKYQVEYTAILEIPSIKLKRGVVDSTDNFKSINYSISVDQHSSYPDKYGNFILYAHSGNSNIAFFNNLDKLVIGDEVIVYFNGIKYYYEIFDIYNTEKTGKLNVTYSQDKKNITLVTCNKNKKNYQIVLVGNQIKTESY